MRKLIVIMALLGILAACEPNQLPPSSGGGSTKVTNGTHVVWGDSLAWQATNYGPGELRVVEGRNWYVYPGMGMQQLKGNVTYTFLSKPDAVVLALGTNDAGFWDGRDGWTAQDEAAWTEVLSYRDPATKVAVVLPHVQLGSVVTPADIESIERARCWLSQLAGVNIVDWRDYAATGVLDTGGIHVTAGYEGVRYQATVAGDPL